MKRPIILAAMLLLSATLGLRAQSVIHPITYGSGAGMYYTDNWYKNYVGVRLDVTAPTAIGGEKQNTISNDGSGATGMWGGILTSPLVNKTIVMPQAGDSLCTAAITTSMTGKVALVYRGSNEYSDKALAAQTAGAVACIVVDNVAEAPIGMAAGVVSASVTIPVLMISKADGDAMDALYCSGTSVTVTITKWGRNNVNDLGFVPDGLAGWSNYATPANQLNGGSTRKAMSGLGGAFVANYGTHKATNVKVKDTLRYTPTGGSATVVHTGVTSNLATFLAVDSIYALFNPAEYNFPATAAGNGRFDIKYNIVSDSVDQYTPDNTATYSFYKTDSLYSKGRYDFANGKPVCDEHLAPIGVPAYMWGPLYHVAHGGTSLSSVQFSLGMGLGISGPITMSSVTVHAYKWVDGSGGQPLDSFVENGELTHVSQGQYYFTASDTANGTFKATMGDASGYPNYVLLDSNSWYYIAVEVPSGYYLGVDGKVSPYPRVLGRDAVANYIDYSNIMWPGDHYSLASSYAGDAEYPCAFPGTYYVDAVDSFNYNQLKGLIPAVSMIVNNNPISAIGGLTYLCAGMSSYLSDPIAGGTWSSSNPAVATIGSATGMVTSVMGGTAIMTYATSTASATTTVTVLPMPFAGTITGPSAVCVGLNITLSDLAPGGTWTAYGTAAVITGGSGSDVVLTGGTTGSVSVDYVVNNVCGVDGTTKVITVGPEINKGSISGTATVCVGHSTTLYDVAPSGIWSATTGNASVFSGVVAGVSAGIDTIKYTVTTSCGSDAAIDVVTVNATASPVIVVTDFTLSTTLTYATYQWNLGGSPIGGATDPTYDVTLDGAYSVSVSDGGGCTGISPLAIISNVGVEDINAASRNVIITPNPTSGAFSVNATAKGTVSIYGLEGRKLKQYNVAKGNNALQLPEGLAAGIYMCRYNGDDGSMAIVRLVYEPK